MTCPHRRTPWTRARIQSARRASLPELLSAKGFSLCKTGAGNYRIREYPGIVVKDSFWREPQTDRAGNAIDFFVDVLGMAFNQAMREISQD